MPSKLEIVAVPFVMQSKAMPDRMIKVTRTDKGQHPIDHGDLGFLRNTAFPVDRVTHISAHYGQHPTRYDVEVCPLQPPQQGPAK